MSNTSRLIRPDVRSEDDVPVEVDGELIGQLPMEFGFSQRKLKVLAPG